jgi:hypothetical protein
MARSIGHFQQGGNWQAHGSACKLRGIVVCVVSCVPLSGADTTTHMILTDTTLRKCVVLWLYGLCGQGPHGLEEPDTTSHMPQKATPESLQALAHGL